MTEKPSIGIMGGTFDPIHYGHLALAEEAHYRFGLKRVLFVPCKQPPHKKDYQITDPEQRFEMTRLAIQDNPKFEVSRVELDRPGYSYTIDTVSALRQANPQVGSYYFITGADAILEILTWKEPHRLADLCQLVAASRPGYDLSAFQERVGEDLARRIHVLCVPGVDISSTDLRRRVSQGAPIRYLIPDSARAYIETRGLYH